MDFSTANTKKLLTCKIWPQLFIFLASKYFYKPKRLDACGKFEKWEQII